MAQGTRRRWVRAATTGLSVMLCTGLVGCMDKDKKDTKATTAPKAGLPGTPMLPQTNTGAAKWQPNTGAFGGAGSNIQPTGGGFGTQPGAAPYQPGRTGMNTNTGGSVQPANYTAQPGFPGALGAPVQPTGGYPTPSVQPGPIGAAPVAPAGGVAAGYSPSNPPAPALGLDGPLPPPAPTHGEFAGGALVPPAPPTPIAPPSAPIYQPIKGNF